MRRSFTNDVTIVPKAAPITTATARSTTLPRMRNARKSLSIALPPLGAGGSSPVPIVGGSIAAATSRRRVSGLGRHFEGVVIDPQLRSIILPLLTAAIQEKLQAEQQAQRMRFVLDRERQKAE